MQLEAGKICSKKAPDSGLLVEGHLITIG